MKQYAVRYLVPIKINRRHAEIPAVYEVEALNRIHAFDIAAPMARAEHPTAYWDRTDYMGDAKATSEAAA